MEERQAGLLKQQANTFCLLETLVLGQGLHGQDHPRSAPERQPPFSPRPSKYTRDERTFERTPREERHYGRNSPAPQLLVKDHCSLKPEEIATFNPSSGDDIEVFCRRIQDMAAAKGQAAVCEVLPQCLRSTATDWYTNLSEVEHARLRTSTDAWTWLLRDRFGMSVTEAHNALSTLPYDINGDYHAYHERKIRLARIAGINAPEQIVQYIFAGLPFEMRAALTSSLEGIESGDLNVFRRRCLATKATLITRRADHKQSPAPAFKQPLQTSRPQQLVGPLPSFPTRALADRPVQRPPPRPCRHCGGSHWDTDCTKTSKPLARTSSAVVAHHAVATAYTGEDYADLEYRYQELDRVSHSTDLSDADDVPSMTYSPEASANDSFGSA
ncbi:uncharacterized protein UBRO2_00679 [Ustilago bromivora]|uniref:Uncharacterized protein n=1 Tax=Ustilago bromivora TaxID=307758 RepID=A0A8H8QJU0_9BASI|nr:uncharacterized protein UBRO2_00679 [Ustilago bromivora]